uniref:Carbonyl reductase 1 n=1 Tax=Sus scrofa TaxID=9823 RepID=A0A287BRI4_PIG
MSSHTLLALVTGANKPIGFAIVRDLCRQFAGDVVLTARDVARGQAAVKQLPAKDLQSIRALCDFLHREYGGLDMLVNNVAIAFQLEDPTLFHIQAELTMKTNFLGTRDVCTELLPLIKPQGESDWIPSSSAVSPPGQVSWGHRSLYTIKVQLLFIPLAVSSLLFQSQCSYERHLPSSVPLTRGVYLGVSSRPSLPTSHSHSDLVRCFTLLVGFC